MGARENAGLMSHLHIHLHDAFSEQEHPRGEGGKFSTSQHQAAKEHHESQHKYHHEKAKEHGENVAKPGAGSHANAASLHHSAAYYHERAVAEPNNESYEKQSKRNSSLANSASKKIAKMGENYAAEKENKIETGPGLTPQQQAARRGAKYLSQTWIKPRRR